MTAVQRGLLTMLAASIAVLVLVWALDELLRPAVVEVRIVTDLVPPWMAAQLQEEARRILQGEVMPDDAS
jgi:hypothetical protein